MLGVAAADFDEDGDNDLLISEIWGKIYLYENDGTGSFGNATEVATVGSFPGWRYAFGLVAGNFNGDSHADFVVGAFDGGANTVKLFQGNGDGTFGSSSSIIITGDRPWKICAADFDGDDDLDLMIGCVWHFNYLLNDGTGSFYSTVLGSSEEITPYPAPEPGDFDGDGDMDLMVGRYNGEIKYFTNNGTGHFSYQGLAGTVGDKARGLAAGDFLTEVEPTTSITTDKYEYFPSDTMTVNIDIVNPTKDSLIFQWYWGVPQFLILVPVMSVPIPAGYEDTLDFSFTMPYFGSTPFGNVFYVQLLNASGEVLDADAACWVYSPSGEAMPPIDIAKEIKKKIEKVEY